LIFKVFVAIHFIVYLALSATNDYHELVQHVTRHTITNRDSVLMAEFGFYFFVNVIISYTLILMVMIKLAVHLKTNKNTKDSFIPYAYLILIVFVGLLINLFHVFVFNFPIDPTYIFVVSFAYYLYWIVFTKDFQLRLLVSSRNELVNEMQENYIITEMNGEVVEFSKGFYEYFSIDSSHTKTIDAFMDFINNNAIVYENFEAIQDKTFKNKPYFYINKKEFEIPGFERKGILYLFYDETRFVQMVDKLNYALKYDTMTGLYNRNHFDKHYDYFEEKHNQCGVIITDLNGLKLYNDFLGHRIGDKIIETYAEILKAIDVDDLKVYRFGGDEFLIYKEKTTLSELRAIESHIHKKAKVTKFPTKISASTGLALRRKDESLSNLINRADNALYEQKGIDSPEFKTLFKEWLNKG